MSLMRIRAASSEIWNRFAKIVPDSTIVQQTRRPPNAGGSISRIFYRGGSVRRTSAHRVHILESLKAYWVTKQMADNIDDPELKVRMSLVEFAMLVIFLMLIITMTIGIQYPSMYLMVASIRGQFIDSLFVTPGGGQLTFPEIRTTSEAWAYLNGHLLSSLYWEYFYDRTDRIAIVPQLERHVLWENNIISTPRIRMVRVKRNSCSIHSAFRRQFQTCYDYYTPASEENDMDIGRSRLFVWPWQPGHPYDRPFTGRFATYGTGGYMVALGRYYAEAKKKIMNIKENDWITRATRAIFIDFALYNGNLNMFCSVKLVIEYPPTGGVFTDYAIRPVNFFAYESKHDFFILGVQFTFIFMVIYYILEEIREIFFFGIRYFTYFGNIYDVICLSLACYVSYYILFQYTKFYIILETILKSDRSKHINFSKFAHAHRMYYVIHGLMTFLYLLRTIRFLDWQKYLIFIIYTLNRSVKELFYYFVMYFMVYAAYTEFAYMLFGSEIEDFATFGRSCLALLTELIGNYDSYNLYYRFPVLGPMFILSFQFLILYLIINITIAIIYDTYEIVRFEKMNVEAELTASRYLWRGIMHIIRPGTMETKASADDRASALAVQRIREALLKCNFTFTEIDMFLAKYGIDEETIKITHNDIRKILKDLDRKGIVPMVTKNIVFSGNDKLNMDEIMFIRNLLKKQVHRRLTIKDFETLQMRLEIMEKQIDMLSDRLIVILEMLEDALIPHMRLIQEDESVSGQSV